METALVFILEKVYIMIKLYSWSLGGEDIHISINNKVKLVMLYLRMLHMVHQYHSD